MSWHKPKTVWPDIKTMRSRILNLKEEWTIVSSTQPEVDVETVAEEAQQPDPVQLTQTNKELSEGERMSKMKEHFENWLLIGPDNLVILKQELDDTRRDLAKAKIRCKEKTKEADELKQQLQRCSEEKAKMMEEIKELHRELDEEKCRNADSELQSSQLQSLMVKRHNASLDEISDLEQQVHHFSLELQDEMENSSYLKTQLLRVLNKLQRSAQQLSKRKQQNDDKEEEEEQSIYEEMRPLWNSDRSSLGCPVCQIRCPVSQYRQMIDHLEVCLN
ncbi:centrosomal protein of 55 kDa-like [Corythoichthys intestinalis]|uniref:centrosomal protein of 55 kDa-like n=1 Tax=Corythoichthys intestinalis TaxID=161448 RepID=UPI0025A60B11|nr:centrosomal protein of 55 kDa-like [Corythoichthys intestinalis]